MFDTCEWNDNPEAQRLTQSLVTAQRSRATVQEHAASRRKRLKRNRQLLEVLRTLKRPSAHHPDLQPPTDLGPPQTQPVPTDTVTLDSPAPELGHRLSRQQWRNKQKNRKRKRNKFSGPSGCAVPRTAEEENPVDCLNSGGQGDKSVTGGADVSDGTRNTRHGPCTSHVPGTGGPRREGEQSRVSGHSRCHQQPCRVTPAEKTRLRKLRKLLRGEDHGRVGDAGEVGRSEHLKEDHGQVGDAGEVGRSEQLKEDHVDTMTERSASLRYRMEQRLKSARFRYINEQLYMSDSQEALSLFQRDPEAFNIYHSGFSQQVERWPTNPITEIIKYIKNRPSSLVVADFGCGDALLARSVRNTVHSYDLVALNDHVTVCDMAQVPLSDGSVDIAVFCLSLMGKNLHEFLQEGNRVLKVGGVLLVAEVSSRFDDVRQFLSAMSQLGFKNISKNTESSYFFLFEFSKNSSGRAASRHPGLQLRPCLYKKR